MAEGGQEEQEVIAAICPASGFESPAETVAAIQVVPLSGCKCWGGTGQRGGGLFTSVVLYWCAFCGHCDSLK